MNVASTVDQTTERNAYPTGILLPMSRLIVFLGCAWVLAYYLLPNTLWGHSSPLSRLTDLSGGCTSFVSVLAVVGSSLGVWFLYLPFAKSQRQTLALWLVTGCWLVAIMISALQLNKDAEIANAGLSILAALTIGMLAARLIGRPDLAAWLLVTLAAGQAIYALGYQHEHIHSMVIGTIERQRGTFAGQNAISTIMVLSLPFAIGNLIKENDSPLLFPSVVLTAAIVIALSMTWSPVSVLAFGAGLTWLLWRHTGRLVPTILTAMSLVLVAGYVWNAAKPSQVATASIHTTSVEVLPNLSHGMTVFTANPTAGLGVGALRVNVHDSLNVNAAKANVINLEPGNVPLQWLDEMGIAGGLLFLLFVATISQCVRSAGSNLSYSLGASWLALLTLGMLRTPFGTISTLHGTVIVGLLLGTTMLTNREIVAKVPLESVGS